MITRKTPLESWKSILYHWISRYFKSHMPSTFFFANSQLKTTENCLATPWTEKLKWLKTDLTAECCCCCVTDWLSWEQLLLQHKLFCKIISKIVNCQQIVNPWKMCTVLQQHLARQMTNGFSASPTHNGEANGHETDNAIYARTTRYVPIKIITYCLKK